ncbi:uncharacterized protein BX663DRAFT_144956 [Cokeromyces recurvatus]|uniref:uncharacterized protein n=1 Tax=Cokeromyces recurvatus TaxID=90255 RepID=UPI00221EAAAE|nr:uncharacterized protein BX663DRAFT_144956 [Cokeromyces recurvatus]KAI7900725.1 hypothetical protein BX663DRAFT_144956 [Cokeromyces recurvatus]
MQLKLSLIKKGQLLNQIYTNGILNAFLMTDDVLSNKYITLIWTENFFNYFNSIFPILSRPHFSFLLEKNELNPLLKLAVFLLGCRLNNDVNDSKDEKMLYQQLDYLLNTSYDTIHDLSTVQATIIMCWYTHLAGDNHKSASLRYSMATLIQEMNLGYETNKTEDTLDVEMKRRAFWVSYVIDQWLSICTESERYLTANFNTKYPQLEDSQLFALLQHQQSQQKESYVCSLSVESALQINSFTQMILLSKIIGHLLYHDKVESNLTEWLLQLPSYLDYGKSNNDVSPSPVAKLYRIFYYTVQIIMNKQRKTDLSTSICLSAVNSIFHISEQMLEHGQEKYLYNVFFISLTLAATTTTTTAAAAAAASIHTPDRLDMSKRIQLLKKLNCSLLSMVDFNRLLDYHFLMNQPDSNSFHFIYPSPTNSSSSISSRESKQSMNKKRVYVAEEYTEQPDDDGGGSGDGISIFQQDSFIDFHKSDSNQQQMILNHSDIPSSSITQQQQQSYDLILKDLFSDIDNSTTHLSDWIVSSFEASNTCSPASYFTPSHSPLLTFHIKEEDNLTFNLLSTDQQQLFTKFTSL